VVIVALAVLVMGTAVAVGVWSNPDGTTLDAELAHSKPGHERPQLAPGVKRCSNGTQGHTVPADLLGNNASSISTEILNPVNSWVAGNCYGVTQVDGGRRDGEMRPASS
jgi:hypothetical protein